MTKEKNYSTYNQISKGFEIMIMNKTELHKFQKHHQDTNYLVLLPKKKTINPQPPRIKQPTIRQMLSDVIKRLDNIETRLDNIVTKNNLIE